MLLPLDQNGKITKTVLPQAASTLTTIDQVGGDANGNIHLIPGPGVAIVDNTGANTITIGLLGGSASSDTIAVGPGLTGGGIGTRFQIGIATNNWITNGMLGTGVVTGMKLDQFVAGNGLYQDQLGNLNIGHDNSISIIPNGNPAKNNGAIGLNLNNPNTWLALQTFNGGVTVNGTTTQNGPVITNGTQTINGNLIVNGTPEPLAGPNGATYEITDNGDLLVTGSTTTRGNTYLGVGPTNTTNTLGTAGQSANTITGTTNIVTGTVSNNSQAPAVNIGTTQVAGNTNNIGTLFVSTNTISGLTNSIHGATNNIGASGLNPNNANNI